MTAYELVQRYIEDNGDLPAAGYEWEEIQQLCERLKVDLPNEIDVVMVIAIERRQRQEAAGQGKLF